MLFVGLIGLYAANDPDASESETMRYVMDVFTAPADMVKFQYVPGAEDTSESRCPAAPAKVTLPVYACVFEASKVMILAVATEIVKCFQVLFPLIE